MARALRFAIAAAGLALAAAAHGEPAAPKPEVKVGDSWTYRRLNDGKPAGAYEIRVVFAARGVIQIVGVGKGSDREVDTTFTDEWNAVSTRNRVFDPHTGWLRFPLAPGATWQAAFDSRMPRKGAAHSKQQRTVSVKGWEHVTVPAGRFRALRVESEGAFQRVDKKGGGRARNVLWYAPEARRWVKLSLEISTRRGVIERSGEELVAYTLQ